MLLITQSHTISEVCTTNDRVRSQHAQTVRQAWIMLYLWLSKFSFEVMQCIAIFFLFFLLERNGPDKSKKTKPLSISKLGGCGMVQPFSRWVEVPFCLPLLYILHVEWDPFLGRPSFPNSIGSLGKKSRQVVRVDRPWMDFLSSSLCPFLFHKAQGLVFHWLQSPSIWMVVCVLSEQRGERPLKRC